MLLIKWTLNHYYQCNYLQRYNSEITASCLKFLSWLQKEQFSSISVSNPVQVPGFQDVLGSWGHRLAFTQHRTVLHLWSGHTKTGKWRHSTPQCCSGPSKCTCNSSDISMSLQCFLPWFVRGIHYQGTADEVHTHKWAKPVLLCG